MDSPGPDRTPTPAAAGVRAVADPAVDAQLGEAKRWLWSADGRASAEAVLRGRRIWIEDARAALTPDDLLSDAFRAFWNRLRRHGPVEEFHPGGYLTRTMQRLVGQACRGRYRWAAFSVEELEWQLVGGAAGDLGDDLIAGLGTGDALERVRAAIEAADAPDWVRAGALAYVTVLAHPDAVPDDHPVPRPERGARPDEAALWIALWFAGRRDGLFPRPGAPADAAMRKARSRAGTQIRAVVLGALSDVGADQYARRRSA